MHPSRANRPLTTPIAVSLGRWILRYLFANLIDEELRRDEDYRRKLNEGVEKRQAATGRPKAPTSIPLPQPEIAGWAPSDAAATPKANGLQLPSPTPGLAINQATPGPGGGLAGVPETAAATPMSPAEKRTSYASRVSNDDYFAAGISPVDTAPKPTGAPATPAADAADASKEKDKEKEKASDGAKSPGTPFGKKFRMSFGTKKLGRSASHSAQEKPAVVDEKAEESESSSTHEKEVEDNLYGVVQKIHNEYDRRLAEAPDQIVETGMTPSLPSETPVLKLPPNTKIFIQEETSGSVANVYEGTVGGVGKDVALIEQKGPMWLGHVLLQNQIPFKEPSKISFVLHPLGDLPPVASTDGNNRLNANRMLRVKKILSYVSERIEQQPAEPEDKALKPEEYLELYCNDQVSEGRRAHPGSLPRASADAEAQTTAAGSPHEPGNPEDSRLEGRQRHCPALQVQRPQGDPPGPASVVGARAGDGRRAGRRRCGTHLGRSLPGGSSCRLGYVGSVVSPRRRQPTVAHLSCHCITPCWPHPVKRCRLSCLFVSIYFLNSTYFVYCDTRASDAS